MRISQSHGGLTEIFAFARPDLLYKVELSGEFNKDSTVKLPVRVTSPRGGSFTSGPPSLAESEMGGSGGGTKASSMSGSRTRSPSRMSMASSPTSPTSSSRHGSSASQVAFNEPQSPRRSAVLSSILATSRIAVQQPFLVTISVQSCSQYPLPTRRYFVQALLLSRAPISMTLHQCRLCLPPLYRLVQDGNAHLEDVVLSPGQDVRYTYLIERAAPGSPGLREVKSKMSVQASYTWDNLDGQSGRLKRHRQPQNQVFERYFQDSAMLSRGDSLRTFMVRAQVVPAKAKENGAQLEGILASSNGTAGDVEERGVVVGHFLNTVTDGTVGVALCLDFSVELCDEAEKEFAAKPLRLGYEVSADPADWALSGFAKGTLVIESGKKAAVECKVVPVRIGMLTCPSVLFQPLDVRQAVSPKSRKKVRDARMLYQTGRQGLVASLHEALTCVVAPSSVQNNVRWIGPRDIQIFPDKRLHSRQYPLVKVATPS